MFKYSGKDIFFTFSCISAEPAGRGYFLSSQYFYITLKIMLFLNGLLWWYFAVCILRNKQIQKKRVLGIPTNPKECVENRRLLVCRQSASRRCKVVAFQAPLAVTASQKMTDQE